MAFASIGCRRSVGRQAVARDVVPLLGDARSTWAVRCRCQIAAEVAADRIVTGSQGQASFKKLAPGSVTQAVLASGNAPLLNVAQRCGAEKGFPDVGWVAHAGPCKRVATISIV